MFTFAQKSATSSGSRNQGVSHALLLFEFFCFDFGSMQKVSRFINFEKKENKIEC